jgi:predicted adenine nucleotide alpha hydrolase (AANH) superfamily ATPase
MFEEMMQKGLDVTIFFYNPNIHPRKEYNIRKEENKRYAVKWGVDFVDCDYDSGSWFDRMKVGQ